MMSSASSQHLEFTCSGMLMKARKRIGLSTPPCGTQDVTAASTKHSPSTTTYPVGPALLMTHSNILMIYGLIKPFDFDFDFGRGSSLYFIFILWCVFTFW